MVVGSSSNSLSQFVAERSAISGGLKVEGTVEGRGRKDGTVLAAIQWTGYFKKKKTGIERFESPASSSVQTSGDVLRTRRI